MVEHCVWDAGVGSSNLSAPIAHTSSDPAHWPDQAASGVVSSACRCSPEPTTTLPSSEAIDGLPAWALAALGDAVIRVEQAPRPGGLVTEPGLRLVVYRAALALRRPATATSSRRLARADLVRALVWQLDLADEHAHELGAELVAS